MSGGSKKVKAILLALLMCMWAEYTFALGLAAQITNISDFNLPNWGIGDSAPSAHIDVCVYSVGVIPLNSYTIKISSAGGYVLTSGGNQIPYELYWDDGGAGNLGSGLGTQLSNGVTLTAQSNANILSALCALGVTGPNARLNLKITQASMISALAGTYNGTITLLLSPS